MKIFYYYYFLFYLSSCTSSTKPTTKDFAEMKTRLFSEIHIVPLGKFDKHSMALIEDGIEKFYGLKAIIANPVALTQDLLANSGTFILSIFYLELHFLKFRILNQLKTKIYYLKIAQ